MRLLQSIHPLSRLIFSQVTLLKSMLAVNPLLLSETRLVTQCSSKKLSHTVVRPHLSMKIGKKPLLGAHDERLHLVLEPKPLELRRDQFVAGHYRVNLALPATVERPPSRLGRLERGRVFVGLVVTSRHRIGGNVDEDNLALLQFFRRQLVKIFGRAPVSKVVRLHADAEVVFHVAGIG